jgi:hypothetical protein
VQDLARSIEKLRADKRKLAEELESVRARAAAAKPDQPPRRAPSARTDLRRSASRPEAEPTT